MKNGLLTILTTALTLFTTHSKGVFASDDSVVKQWKSPAIGYGSYGRAGLDFDSIEAILGSSNPTLCKSIEVVKGQDYANGHDINTFAKFIRSQLEEKSTPISVNDIIEVMQQDISLLEQANARKTEVPIFISTSLKRLTKLDDGTPWYLYRAINLLKTYPHISQGNLPAIDLYS